MIVILFGPPAAGKGTQAARIKEKYTLAHLSTGDMLRAAIAAGTEVGKRAKAIMDSGKLVPDDVVIGIIADRIGQDDCKRGFILDGFPRTVAQAEALDALLSRHGQKIDLVIRLEVDEAQLLARVTKRFQDQGRADDNPESFTIRLNAYNAQTAPLVPYYQAKGVLVGVDGMASVEAVAAGIAQAIDGRVR
jgi:adenylate kinase